MVSSQNYFFSIFLGAVFILAILIFLPFLAPLVLAVALAVIFTPLHQKITYLLFRNNEKSSISAFITVIVIALLVFVPIIFILLNMYSEVKDIYVYMINESGRSQVINLLNNLSQSVSKLLFGVYPSYSFDSFNIVEVIKNTFDLIASNLSTVISSVSKILISFFVMCLALFYLLRDGRELKNKLVQLSPLSDIDDERIFKKLGQAIRSIFAGSLTVGVIQGILTGIGFLVFGVPSPALWGVVAAVAALIPGVGTSLVLIPGIAYLFLIGANTYGIGLLIWSVVAVGLIDNFLGPILVNRGVKIHPFLILLSIIGGITFFGIIGFVLGPIVLALLFSLLEIYSDSKKK